MDNEGVIHLVVDLEILVGTVMAIIVPTLLFWWRLHGMAKRNLDMHLDPDNHGFGTTTTNGLLSQHMADEQDMHAESLAATKYLTHTIRELSHYVRWMAKEQMGKSPPPFVRNGNNGNHG